MCRLPEIGTAGIHVLTAEPFPLPDGIEIFSSLASNADRWFWPAAMFDPPTGQLEPVQEPRMPSTSTTGWTQDGGCFAILGGARGSTWRCRAE